MEGNVCLFFVCFFIYSFLVSFGNVTNSFTWTSYVRTFKSDVVVCLMCNNGGMLYFIVMGKILFC